MKLSLPYNLKCTSLELVALAMFIAYIVLPIETPRDIAAIINSPVGILALFAVTVFLFIYTSPILGVVYIWVAYELMNRSTTYISSAISTGIQFTPIRSSINSNSFTESEITQHQPQQSDYITSSHGESLEEDIISTMAPLGRSETAKYVETTFKPIAENIHNAYSA
jgi:hypothetical protein